MCVRIFSILYVIIIFCCRMLVNFSTSCWIGWKMRSAWSVYHHLLCQRGSALWSICILRDFSFHFVLSFCVKIVFVGRSLWQTVECVCLRWMLLHRVYVCMFSSGKGPAYSGPITLRPFYSRPIALTQEGRSLVNDVCECVRDWRVRRGE